MQQLSGEAELAFYINSPLTKSLIDHTYIDYFVHINSIDLVEVYQQF